MNMHAIHPAVQGSVDQIFSNRVDDREADLWTDLETVSEATWTLDCLTVRARRTYTNGSIHNVYPPVKTGEAALTALRNKDFAEFGRLVYAEVAKEIRELAREQVEGEDDER